MKTKFMIVRSQQTDNSPLVVNDLTFDNVTEFKYLGTTVQFLSSTEMIFEIFQPTDVGKQVLLWIQKLTKIPTQQKN